MINKKHLILIGLFASIFSIVRINAQNHKFYNVNLFDANNITIPFTNVGSIDDYRKLRVPESNWNFMGYNDYIVFDQGLWVVGKVNDEPRLALNQWNSSYSPGPIIGGKSAPLETMDDSLKYRVYKILKGDTKETNPDVAEWPVDLGAPADERGNPIVYADQTLFTVYNAATPDNFIIKRWQESGDSLMQPLPLEIRQLVYGYNRFSPFNILSNVVFFEWEIINKGSKLIDSTFIALWTDIDFYGATNNKPAIDTVNQLGYCWYGDSLEYRENTSAPPAVGYTMLYGPSKSKQGSGGYFRGNNKNDIINQPLYSFHAIADDSSPGLFVGPAYSVSAAWAIAKAEYLDGSPIINDSTGMPTRFPFSGDPVKGEGWIFEYNPGGGSGFVMFSGPFDFAPGDTQWVMAALIPALGDDRFDSITELRLNTKALHSIPYNRLVDKTIIKIHEDPPIEYFYLSQNYPNPFNGVTTINYSIPDADIFEDVPVSLKVYNILGQEIVTLVNENQNPGHYNVRFNPTGLSNGIYFYQLTIAQYMKCRQMVLLK